MGRDPMRERIARFKVRTVSFGFVVEARDEDRRTVENEPAIVETRTASTGESWPFCLQCRMASCDHVNAVIFRDH